MCQVVQAQTHSMNTWRTRPANMNHLLSDLDRYSACYKAYASFSQHKLSLYQEWAKDTFSTAAAKTLATFFSPDDEFRMLGVGSGGGEIDCCLLEHLSPHFSNIVNTVLEPSSEMIAKYKSLLDQKGTILSRVKTHFNQSTIQKFRHELKEQKKTGEPVMRYHFIQAIHSLYYASSLRDAIVDLYDLLEDGGILLIILMTNEHIMYQLSDHFSFVSSAQMEDNAMTNLSSRDAGRILEDLDVKYSSHTQPWRVDMSACFDMDSETGNKILDFIMQTTQFRASAPSQLREDVMSFLKRVCPSEESSETLDGNSSERIKYYFIRDWQSIFVYKEKSNS